MPQAPSVLPLKLLFRATHADGSVAPSMFSGGIVAMRVLRQAVPVVRWPSQTVTMFSTKLFFQKPPWLRCTPLEN